MKKYIRTKDDKIYCTNDLEKNEILNRKPFVHRKTKKLIYPTYIKREADTIQELCDEFVFIDEFFKRKHRLAYSLENALARCKYHDVDITTLRGAVWTDEGLIYVAKMNRKGELELL